MSRTGSLISKEKLVENLQAFSDELGHTPTYQEMVSEGPHSGSIYHRKFGSWNNAVDAAGLKPKQPDRPIASARTNHQGHRELEVRDRGADERHHVMIHRLHATLLVDELEKLDGKIVHHTNGCPFDNRLENYEIVNANVHRERHCGLMNLPPVKTLCQFCDNACYHLHSNIQFCPSCGRRLDCAEINEAEYIDWQIEH